MTRPTSATPDYTMGFREEMLTALRRFAVEPTPEPTPTPDESSETNQAPSFSLAASGLSFQQGDEITEDTPPEADGGEGEPNYSLTPSLPKGLSFDPATRIISGTPTGAGEFSMTYAAADAPSP